MSEVKRELINRLTKLGTKTESDNTSDWFW